MFIDEACVSCIVNQSTKVANALGADASLEQKLYSHVEGLSQTFSYKKSPPEIAADVYEDMAMIAKSVDLYEAVKKASTKKAASFIPSLEKKLKKSSNKLLTATKIAVAGNVIDLAAAVEFDLEEELEKIFETAFAEDDFEKFALKLASAKSLLVLGDNVGEHIFDYLFIETVQALYPQIEVSYMVRGNPIINDVTMKEAKEAGFDRLCQLVDSGVNTPGFTYDRANEVSQKLFDSADLVVSKGMGNYECLTPSHRRDITFLLKVKCGVVANSLNKNIGDIICKMV